MTQVIRKNGARSKFGAWCGQCCCYNGIFTSEFASLFASRLVWMGLVPVQTSLSRRERTNTKSSVSSLQPLRHKPIAGQNTRSLIRAVQFGFSGLGHQFKASRRGPPPALTIRATSTLTSDFVAKRAQVCVLVPFEPWFYFAGAA